MRGEGAHLTRQKTERMAEAWFAKATCTMFRSARLKRPLQRRLRNPSCIGSHLCPLSEKALAGKGSETHGWGLVFGTHGWEAL